MKSTGRSKVCFHRDNVSKGVQTRWYHARKHQNSYMLPEQCFTVCPVLTSWNIWRAVRSSVDSMLNLSPLQTILQVRTFGTYQWHAVYRSVVGKKVGCDARWGERWKNILHAPAINSSMRPPPPPPCTVTKLAFLTPSAVWKNADSTLCGQDIIM